MVEDQDLIDKKHGILKIGSKLLRAIGWRPQGGLFCKLLIICTINNTLSSNTGTMYSLGHDSVSRSLIIMTTVIFRLFISDCIYYYCAGTGRISLGSRFDITYCNFHGAVSLWGYSVGSYSLLAVLPTVVDKSKPTRAWFL